MEECNSYSMMDQLFDEWMCEQKARRKNVCTVCLCVFEGNPNCPNCGSDEIEVPSVMCVDDAMIINNLF